WITILGALTYLIGVLALFIIPANRKPGEATAWLLLIFAAPILGAILFLLLGSPKLSKWRRDQQQHMNERIKDLAEEAEQTPALAPIVDPPLSSRFEPHVNLIAQLTGMPVMAGNTVELLPDYVGAIDRIVRDIDAAKHFVHIEYFMFADDKIGSRVIDALVRARERGVVCRVLIDHLSNLLLRGPVLKKLGAAGIPVHEMLPAKLFDNQWNRIDLRNHRKIVVVDGVVGFTGSHNLIEDTYHKRSNIRNGVHYIELVARVTGPVVREFNAAFITDWYSETEELLDERTAPEMRVRILVTGEVLCQVLPSGPGFEHNNNLMLFVALFHAARRRITIVNPYVVPEETLLLALTTAAQRGVEVTLIVSEIGDQFLVYHAQSSYYEELLKAGVNIYRYRAPVILHSKSISIDDDIAVIGSSNMDIRSFELNLEISLVCYNTQVVADLRKLEEGYLRRSRQLSLDAWHARPLHTKLLNNLARLTSVLQ
ncbi:MAG TPA: cardiolipin synthase, partial [Anaerolineales bacterium]|nr:cardiolipin synthase [Anaerolineales bacterium]